MYETTWWGWTVTPEELNKLKCNKHYRRKMNWKFLVKQIQHAWNFRRDIKDAYGFYGKWSYIKWDIYCIWTRIICFVFNKQQF